MTPAPALRFAAARVYRPATDPASTVADCATRAIARALKAPRSVLFRYALRRAVREMAAHVPAGAQLVPVPRASGCSGPAVLLASALASAVPCTTVVLAVQRRQPVESSQMRRRRGLTGLAASEHAASFARMAALDPTRSVVFVDNVVVTGATAQGVAWVLGRPDALVLAFAAGVDIASVVGAARAA
ncbi:MAG: hypothetical protein H3C62_00780 [Gemmatimonadaceae bacterium]|nr:hypothetical protein [Gemmatimonadaceae bacterium]